MNFFAKFYYWLWHDFVCRLESWSDQWRRHVKRWWKVDLVVLALWVAFFTWLLLFPLSNAALWVKIVAIVIAVLGVTFLGWLLLHLGGLATRIRRWFGGGD